MIANHRTPLARMLPAALAVVLAACGGAAPGSPLAPDQSGAGAPTAAATVPAPAAPAAGSGVVELPADIPGATLDVVVDGVLASGEITPERGGTITATTQEGVTWTLVVGPWAVRKPVTVELRPMAGGSTLGRVIAGVDLAPAGLRLAEPATLTAEGLDVAPTVVALEFAGQADGADARLVIGPAVGSRSLAFSVAHFSGNVAIDVGNDANALFEKWSAARGDDTTGGRQAAAETRYAAAALAERNGRISQETAREIQARAMAEWMRAEADRLEADPALAKLAESGDPRDLDVIDAEISRILQVEHQLAVLGDESPREGLVKVVEILQTYEAAIISKVIDSQRIQEAASSGLVSEMGEVVDLIGVVLSLERRIMLLGGEGSDVMAKVLKLLENLRTGLLASCAKAPLDPAIVLGLERMVQLLGGAGSASIADVIKCAAPQGWLVTAEDDYIAGSQRLCATNPLDPDPDIGGAGVYVESNGGMPDDWPPDKVYELADGILLDFSGGTYSVYFAKGTAKHGTIYEFNGRLTVQVDAAGLPLKGSGSGKGRILYPNGDVKNGVPDTLTITFSRIPEPAWCTEPIPE